MRTLMKRLARSETGAALVEFALIAPALCVTILGLFDISYNYYAESIIEGAVQKAARDSTVEDHANNPAGVDGKVRDAVHNLVPDAAVTFTRTAFADYADMNRPEDFTDTNGDGVCNNNEPFDDANGNGTHDDSRSLDVSNGARSAVLYEVNATYDRAFPLAGLIGLAPTVTVSARTVLRNQPFNKTDDVSAVGNCA